MLSYPCYIYISITNSVVLKDLIPDSTIWSEVEILSLIVCSCVPCLRNIVKKFPRFNRILGLSETSSVERRLDEEARHRVRPLNIKTLIRTGLTPSTLSRSVLSTTQNSTRDLNHLSRRMATITALNRPRSLVAFHHIDLTPSPGGVIYSSGRRASCDDYFPRQFPNEISETFNTTWANSLLRYSLGGQVATMAGQVSSEPTARTDSRRTSIIQSHVFPEEEESDKEADEPPPSRAGPATNRDHPLQKSNPVGENVTIERPGDSQDSSASSQLSPSSSPGPINR